MGMEPKRNPAEPAAALPQELFERSQPVEILAAGFSGELKLCYLVLWVAAGCRPRRAVTVRFEAIAVSLNRDRRTARGYLEQLIDLDCWIMVRPRRKV